MEDTASKLQDLEENNQKAKAPPRKAVVILGLLFVVLVIVIAIIGRGAPQRPEPTPPVESPDTKIGELAETYESALFTFQYPDGWRTQLYTLRGGGDGVSITPGSTQEAFPRFHIEAGPIQEGDSLQERVDRLSTNLDVERSETTVLGHSAIKLTGILPIQPNGTTVKKPVLKSYIFFENAGYLYIITYAYYEGDKEAEKEQFFQNILDSVTLLEGAL